MVKDLIGDQVGKAWWEHIKNVPDGICADCGHPTTNTVCVLCYPCEMFYYIIDALKW